jgi:hypothetical protein
MFERIKEKIATALRKIVEFVQGGGGGGPKIRP